MDHQQIECLPLATATVMLALASRRHPFYYRLEVFKLFKAFNSCTLAARLCERSCSLCRSSISCCKISFIRV